MAKKRWSRRQQSALRARTDWVFSGLQSEGPGSQFCALIWELDREIKYEGGAEPGPAWQQLDERAQGSIIFNTHPGLGSVKLLSSLDKLERRRSLEIKRLDPAALFRSINPAEMAALYDAGDHADSIGDSFSHFAVDWSAVKSENDIKLFATQMARWARKEKERHLKRRNEVRADAARLAHTVAAVMGYPPWGQVGGPKRFWSDLRGLAMARLTTRYSLDCSEVGELLEHEGMGGAFSKRTFENMVARTKRLIADHCTKIAEIDRIGTARGISGKLGSSFA